jgi:hypothetical protein
MEVAVEVRAAVERPDDARDRDRAHADVGLTDDSQPATNLLERQEVHGYATWTL